MTAREYPAVLRAFDAGSRDSRVVQIGMFWCAPLRRARIVPKWAVCLCTARGEEVQAGQLNGDFSGADASAVRASAAAEHSRAFVMCYWEAERKLWCRAADAGSCCPGILRLGSGTLPDLARRQVLNSAWSLWRLTGMS